MSVAPHKLAFGVQNLVQSFALVIVIQLSKTVAFSLARGAFAPRRRLDISDLPQGCQPHVPIFFYQPVTALLARYHKDIPYSTLNETISR